MNPKDINLEALLEIAKDNLNGECKLKPVLNDALNSFKLKLSEYTLADII